MVHVEDGSFAMGCTPEQENGCRTAGTTTTSAHRVTGAPGKRETVSDA